jgi:uroporphyrinogen decarboxylase
MNTVERVRASLAREGCPDRVPVHVYPGLDLLRQLLPQAGSRRDLLRLMRDDPRDTIVRVQQNLGLDPIVTTYSQHPGEMETWAELLAPRRLDGDGWEERIVRDPPAADGQRVEHRIKTRHGELTYAYRFDANGAVPLTHVLDGDMPEAKLERLRCRPVTTPAELAPLANMAQSVAADAWWTHYVVGPWGLAVEVRGLETLLTDLVDRPSFVHELMQWATDWITAHIAALAPYHPPSICLNETWVGIGLSPRVYRNFVQPYDRRCIAAAKAAGAFAVYHDCGRGMAILGDLMDIGPDGLETLTPASQHGDFDLTNVKQRVGDRCCLIGGFDNRAFALDAAAVEQEAARCLAAAGRGGYILRPVAQVLSARLEQIETLCKYVDTAGRY